MDPHHAGTFLVGGAGCIDACRRFLLACSVLPAWGERAHIALSLPGGKEQSWVVNGLNLGAVPEGAAPEVVVTVRNISKQPLVVDMFATGSKLSAAWVSRTTRATTSTRYVNRVLLPAAGNTDLRITFRAVDTSVQDFQSVNLLQAGVVLSRLVVKYQIRPGSVSVSAKTPPLVSGVKKDFNRDYYQLCSGPAPFGYTLIASSIVFKAEAGGGHPRSCAHHVECVPASTSDQNVCYNFKIQGDEDGDVLHVPASLDVKYALKTAPAVLE